MTRDIAFLMEQNAGHLTNYHNLRKVIDGPGYGDIRPTWHELTYHRQEGRIEQLRDHYLPFVPTYVTGNTRMVLEFRRAISEAPYDAIFTNSWAGIFSIRQLAKVPTVIDFDSTPRQIDRMPAYGSPADVAPLAALKYRLHQRAYRSARLLHARSNWAKQSVVEEYGIPEDKVIVNLPGVDLDFLTPSGPLHSEKSVGCRILFVGADFQRKGGDLLLDWFDHQTWGDLELHLVTRESVGRRPGVTVHPGVLPNSPELIRLYQESDVFVLPSLGECFGIATIEAMAAGLPVIVSDAGGTADIVEHGENGFITRAGDIEDFALVMEAVLSDSVRRRLMGARSRQLAEARFDMKRSAARTVDLLRGLAADRQPMTGMGHSERSGPDMGVAC
jgi:glycosyltransferase involved in cell wall biosynthesis